MRLDRVVVQAMLVRWAEEADEYARLAGVHKRRGQQDMAERYLDMECVLREKIEELKGLP